MACYSNLNEIEKSIKYQITSQNYFNIRKRFANFFWMLAVKIKGAPKCGVG